MDPFSYVYSRVYDRGFSYSYLPNVREIYLPWRGSLGWDPIP